MSTIFLNVPDHGRCALLEEGHGSLLVENEGGARFWVPLLGCEIAGAEVELAEPPFNDADLAREEEQSRLFPAMLEKLEACAEILAADPGHHGGLFLDELLQLVAVAKGLPQ